MTQSFVFRPLCSIVLAVSVAAGCGDNSTGAMDAGNNNATTYVPFAESNLTAPRAGVAVFQAIKKARTAPGFDKTRCGDPDAAPAAGTLAELYTRRDTAGNVLRDAVKALKDAHDYNSGAAVGTSMDDNISKALKDCVAGTVAANLAGQAVEKTLVWYSFENIYGELKGALDPAVAEKQWDRAFAAYGQSNDGTDPSGQADDVADIMEEQAVNIADDIFKLFLDGRAAVAGKDSAKVAATVTALDKKLHEHVARHTATEFLEIRDSDEADVKFAEGKYLFLSIEPYMKKNFAADATFIRAEIDKTTYEAARMKMLDWMGILSRIEAAFGFALKR